MAKYEDVPAPVKNLQNICTDILETSVMVDGKLHWCRRGSNLASDPFVSKYQASTSALVKHGLLTKVTIGSCSPLRKSFPESFFVRQHRIGTSTHDRTATVYVVQQSDKLQLLATNIKAAAGFIGHKPEEVPLSFARALQRVKEEINSQPDPSRFLISIIRRLLPVSD